MRGEGEREREREKGREEVREGGSYVGHFLGDNGVVVIMTVLGLLKAKCTILVTHRVTPHSTTSLASSRVFLFSFDWLQRHHETYSTTPSFVAVVQQPSGVDAGFSH